MTINRKVTPAIKQPESFNIVKAEKRSFPNGIALYGLNTGTAELIKIEWMFAAGSWYQSNSFVAFATNSMLSEGSRKYTSAQIAEKIEFYGAHLGCNVDKDNAFVTLTCMNKHLAVVLPIVEDILKNPLFPENELESFRTKHRQQFRIEHSKMRNIARSEHSRMLFGNQHPYGYVAVEEDFDGLTRDKLTQFYQSHYQSQNCTMIAAGKVDDSTIETIEKHFGKDKWNISDAAISQQFEIKTESKRQSFIEKADAVQSAVRIGKVLFSKQHPDFNGVLVLNTVLGGYFGSRLMRKIREEKGYTYGINSMLVTFKHSGYLAIASELGTDVTTPAMADIYAEIALLRDELVPEEELSRVKNYMLGDVVRMFDGPFAQAESLISLLEYGLGYEYFDNMIATIKNITAEEIRALAKKYLDPETLSEAVVGKTE